MKDIILASASPRRRDLFKKYNIDCQPMNSDIKEVLGSSPKTTAMALAFQKAWNLAQNKKDKIVIGADTIVVLGDEILGKAKDKEDAYKMLKLLSGREHKVITGFSIISVEDNIKIVDYEETGVRFKKMDDDLIKSYIDGKEGYDKAGSYAIQGKGGLFVEAIDGCYNNVIGLPMTKLTSILEDIFNYKII